jgi:hypothetical protein
MRKAVRFSLRKAHRYLATLLGVQLLAWILGGVYFSWTELSWIRGESLKRSPPSHSQAVDWRRLSSVLENLEAQQPIEQIEVFPLLGKAALRLKLRNGSFLLLSAEGQILPPLDRTQAVALAKEAFRSPAEVQAIEYLTAVPPGHEYRGKPLPAWAIRFAHSWHPTVYVAAERAEVTAIRHDGWRVFDFLWMLHTLDFQGRDDFNNPWLRVISLLALAMVASGYLVFVTTHAQRSRLKPRSLPPKLKTVDGLQDKSHSP